MVLHKKNLQKSLKYQGKQLGHLKMGDTIPLYYLLSKFLNCLRSVLKRYLFMRRKKNEEKFSFGVTSVYMWNIIDHNFTEWLNNFWNGLWLYRWSYSEFL